jgi:hypothetical protein
MYKKVAVLTACVAATALLLAVSSARAEDAAEGSEGGGATASAERSAAPADRQEGQL